MAAPPEQRQDFCDESVRLSLDNLMTFPWIKTPVAAGELRLYGCFFGIRSGVLERLGADGFFTRFPTSRTRHGRTCSGYPRFKSLSF